MKIKNNGKIFIMTDKEFFIHLKEHFTNYPDSENDLCRLLNSEGSLIDYNFDLEAERWILTYDDEIVNKYKNNEI